MNIAETIYYIVDLIFYTELANAIMLVLLSLCIVYIYIMAVLHKHTFNVGSRLGFAFICIGLSHNVLLRLSTLGLIDDLILIEVPSSLGYLLVQIGIIKIVISLFISKGIKNDK